MYTIIKRKINNDVTHLQKVRDQSLANSYFTHLTAVSKLLNFSPLGQFAAIGNINCWHHFTTILSPFILDFTT